MFDLTPDLSGYRTSAVLEFHLYDNGVYLDLVGELKARKAERVLGNYLTGPVNSDNS